MQVIGCIGVAGAVLPERSGVAGATGRGRRRRPK